MSPALGLLVPLVFFAGMVQAQPIVTNGYFTDSLGNFSFADWYTFCDGTAPTFSCGGNAIGIAPNIMPSPCPYATSPTGVHTKLVGVQVGLPYQLTYCAEVDINDGGNVGIFANTAGQQPVTYYGDGGIVDVWPTFGGPMNYIINFTIPAAYAGQEFWLFAEYSYAPDNTPTMKMYTGFNVVLNSGMLVDDAPQENVLPLIAADGWLRPQPAHTGLIAGIEVHSTTGARLLHADSWNGTSIHGWSPGVYVARVQFTGGRTAWQRFVVEQ